MFIGSRVLLASLRGSIVRSILVCDGIGNAANSHRKVGNAFDVKLQAIHNLHEAGVDIVPVGIGVVACEVLLDRCDIRGRLMERHLRLYAPDRSAIA